MSGPAAASVDELDAMRIRRIAAEKRAANRFWSYVVVGGVVLFALLIQAATVLLRH